MIDLLVRELTPEDAILGSLENVVDLLELDFAESDKAFQVGDFLVDEICAVLEVERVGICLLLGRLGS